MMASLGFSTELPNQIFSNPILSKPNIRQNYCLELGQWCGYTFTKPNNFQPNIPNKIFVNGLLLPWSGPMMASLGGCRVTKPNIFQNCCLYLSLWRSPWVSIVLPNQIFSRTVVCTWVYGGLLEWVYCIVLQNQIFSNPIFQIKYWPEFTPIFFLALFFFVETNFVELNQAFQIKQPSKDNKKNR